MKHSGFNYPPYQNKSTDSKYMDTYLSVLVIENNMGDFILIEDYLNEKFTHISIVHKTNYKQAEEYLRLHVDTCDLILLDLGLPDKNGIDLVKDIFKINNKLPTIILTGYSDLPTAKQSLSLGVSDFLIKDETNAIILHKSIEFSLSRNTYIKQIEKQNEMFKKIAWTQSHVLRSPLSRLLGLIYVIEMIDYDSKELPFILKKIKDSSNEIDEIIQKITHDASYLN